MANIKRQIKLVGVGDYGCKIVRDFIAKAPYVPEFVCINTKNHPDGRYDAVAGLTIGVKTTGGYGCGADPEKGKLAVEESKELLCNELRGYEKVVIVAGFGRGTGTGAATEICRLAKSLGAKTYAVVVTPFGFFGEAAQQRAVDGLKELHDIVDELHRISGEAREQGAKTIEEATERVDASVTDALLEILEEQERNQCVMLPWMEHAKRENKRGIYKIFLILASLLAAAMCVLPIMSTTVYGGESAKLIVRGFNLMNFNAWGCIPVLAPLAVPAILLGNQSKAAKELELILLTMGNMVCYTHSFNAARDWMSALDHSVITYHSGVGFVPFALVTALGIAGVILFVQKEVEAYEHL